LGRVKMAHTGVRALRSVETFPGENRLHSRGELLESTPARTKSLVSGVDLQRPVKLVAADQSGDTQRLYGRAESRQQSLPFIGGRKLELQGMEAHPLRFDGNQPARFIRILAGEVIALS